MACGALHSICRKFAKVLGCTERSNSSISDNLSPAPRIVLANREHYEMDFLNRSIDQETDSPLAALYRIYEHLLLDQHLEIRNEIESFWYHSTWVVSDISDPQDPDPERYACLSCIPALLCLAFNRRLELGLPRNAPPIFTRQMLEEWRAKERQLEREPSWVTRVPRLSTPLEIPHWNKERHDFVCLESFEAPGASKEFAKKNILIWNPHVHFA